MIIDFNELQKKAQNTQNSGTMQNSTLVDVNTVDFAYIDEHRNDTMVERQSSTALTINAFNEEIENRNKQDDAKLHGMSEQEYDEYQAWMYYAYGIEVENLSVGNFQNVAASMEKQLGKLLEDQMAASYDSVLDLVLDEKLNQAIDDIFGEGTMPNWNRLYGARDKLLKEYGIAITKLTNETHNDFSVSLVDKNGNVIQDENGNLAQTIKTDKLMPDGLAQRNEIFNSAVLDMMGYDCFSALDLSAEEYDLIKEMASMDASELGTASRYKYGDTNKALINEKLKQTNGVNADGSIIRSDASEWMNGTYVDEVTGQTTGRKASWRDFNSKHESGYYSTRINSVTNQSVGWKNRSITRNMYAVYEGTGELPASKGGGNYSSGSASKTSTVSSLISSINDNNTHANYAEEIDEPKEVKKIKVSKQRFEELVEAYKEDNHTTETKAIEIISEKYEINYSYSYSLTK